MKLLLKRGIFLGLFVLNTWSLLAQEPNAKALLWEISGNGLKKSSYLYGTIHLIGKDDFFLNKKVVEKFKQTKQVALELDMDDPAMIMKVAGSVFMPDGTTLKDLYTATQYEKLEKYFQDSVGISLDMMQRIKPIVLSSMLTESGIRGDITSYEQVFTEMAAEQKKEVSGLETVEFQMSVFDSIPYKIQADMLLTSIDATKTNDFSKMIQLYKQQDLDGLYQFIKQESSQYKDFDNLLIDRRNESWIERIGKLSDLKPTFIAVGAAHLPGEKGVINLLRKAGYTLTPIPN